MIVNSPDQSDFFFGVPQRLDAEDLGDPPGVIPWWTFTTPGTGAPLTGPPLCPCLLSAWPSKCKLIWLVRTLVEPRLFPYGHLFFMKAVPVSKV